MGIFDEALYPPGLAGPLFQSLFLQDLSWYVFLPDVPKKGRNSNECRNSKEFARAQSLTTFQRRFLCRWLKRTGRIEFGNYGDYQTWPFQVLGVMAAVLIFATVFVGIANSQIFAGFVSYADEREEWVDVTDKDVEMTREGSRDTTISRRSVRGIDGALGGDYKNMDVLEQEPRKTRVGDNNAEPFLGNENAVLT